MPPQEAASEVLKMNESKAPYKRSRSGRFQVSLFKFDRLIRKGNDFMPEQIIKQVRVCIQYSKIDRTTNQWEQQQIWCSPEELRDLGNALSGIAYENPPEHIA